jgi:hypothetical protein
MFEGVFWTYRFRCRLYAEAAWRIHRAERTAPARYRADLANILHYLHGVQLPARR